MAQPPGCGQHPGLFRVVARPLRVGQPVDETATQVVCPCRRCEADRLKRDGPNCERHGGTGQTCPMCLSIYELSEADTLNRLGDHEGARALRDRARKRMGWEG